MRYDEIPHFIRDGSYEVNTSLSLLSSTLEHYKNDEGLILNPDFQRGHVWTIYQQERFIEYFLRGGVSGRVVYFNKPSWQGQATSDYDDFVCVDGLQRLTALTGFAENKIKAFGQYAHEFGGSLRRFRSCDNLRININCLKTKKEVLQWYLQMNSGGTPHTEDELNKVRSMINEV